VFRCECTARRKHLVRRFLLHLECVHVYVYVHARNGRQHAYFVVATGRGGLYEWHEFSFIATGLWLRRVANCPQYVGTRCAFKAMKHLWRPRDSYNVIRWVNTRTMFFLGTTCVQQCSDCSRRDCAQIYLCHVRFPTHMMNLHPHTHGTRGRRFSTHVHGSSRSCWCCGHVRSSTV
jgi:hypothetical protein